MKAVILVLLTATVAIQGCATKTYGRQGSVTDYERDTLTCREIDIELAKVQGFVEHVNTESQFSGRDVLAILGDFGIGNSMERSAALESATVRTQQLRALRIAKSCGQSAASTQTTQPADPPSPSSSTPMMEPTPVTPAVPQPATLESHGIRVIGGPR